ncbi:MAG: secF [Dehalococcoidia bacterium]|nr:secF [Dehalococcoidia bacterium]
MLDFMRNRVLFLRLGFVIVAAGMVLLAVFGLRAGLQFTGGSIMTLVFGQEVGQSDLRQELSNLGYSEAVIQVTHKDGFTVRSGRLAPARIDEVRAGLEAKYGSRSSFVTARDEGDGTLLTVMFTHAPERASLLETLKPLALGDISVAPLEKPGAPAFLVRMRELKQDVQRDQAGQVLPSEKAQLETALAKRFGRFASFDYYVVSPAIAGEVVRNAAIAVAVAAVFVLLYISWAFRRMPSPFRYGACAILALLHDIFFMLGTFAVLGIAAGVEVDAMFIAAMLTISGYSVHDTIVVFDRIRENIRKPGKTDFLTTVNNSIVETLVRSLNTGFATLFVLVALLLFGGVTIRFFLVALLVGLIVGTYSSIFVASQLLVIWERGEWRRFLPWASRSVVSERVSS